MLSAVLSPLSSAMKRILKAITAFSIICFWGVTYAEETPTVPTLPQLKKVVGINATGPEFKRMLSDYRFSENPKRKNSWGSSFGVMFEITNEHQKNVVIIGIRPPSRATNMPTYSGDLPRKLDSEDSIATIKTKLGDPNLSSGNPQEQYVMQYDEMNVVTLGGRLFEIWLIPPPRKPKQSE